MALLPERMRIGDEEQSWHPTVAFQIGRLRG